MILTNIETIPGMKIVGQFGLVSGSTVRAKNAILDMGAGLKNVVGGELKSYTELQMLGANAIVNVRFATSAITAGAAEVYAYGTAVKALAITGE